jgi:hypothetical protein
MLHNFSSPNISAVKLMRWTGHPARMMGCETDTKLRSENPKESVNLKDLSVYDSTTLQEVLGRTNPLPSFDTTRQAQKTKGTALMRLLFNAD